MRLTRTRKILFGALLLRVATVGLAAAPAASTMQQKIAYIQRNAARPHPDLKPTEFTEQEINQFIAGGGLILPAGVKSLTLRGQPGIVTGFAKVDFDEVRAGRNASNPLLSIFSGVHDVMVIAHAHGAGGQGMVDIDSVSLDGTEIPRFVLSLFVDRYIKPKHPNLGLESRFPLPEKIDTARVGSHRMVVTQR